MNIKDYENLKKRIQGKDFEGNNKNLDKFLFIFSFVGNISSIFFSYFLLYPALHNAISVNISDGIWSIGLAFILSLVFLTIFEIIKRYFFRNFTSGFVYNNKKMNKTIFGWFILSMSILGISFYLSIIGSKSLASTANIKTNAIELNSNHLIDSLNNVYELKKKPLLLDNENLRSVNNNLRNKLAETPTTYTSIRKEYQNNIDKNVDLINNNVNEINNISDELKNKINNLNNSDIDKIESNKTIDLRNIRLFIIMAIFSELIILLGIYFRDWYEFNLFQINNKKFDKILLKKDRYRSLLSYIYDNGKMTIGNKVPSAILLKEMINEKTQIQNGNKLIDEFLIDMERLKIFTINGKRRIISMNYDEALFLIEDYDSTSRIIENLK